MEWELFKYVDGEWHEYRLKQNGELVASAHWRLLDENAELHNSAEKSTKSVLIKTREVLQEIKEDMRDVGAKRVVVLDKTENVDKLRHKYWKFMGFEFTGEAHGFTYAVQEV